ncbi:TadE/TadG family type IV pilus assembly protein [Streptomyces sp. NPDC006259]|uniref:TadE/TadG family type IV pilus assembly protein n=1 Tax=unclassified Streptomyces TaxID=2593676 RepID=UPI002E820748|nr:TadE/TadG family type IV pilus assembly protein [Streptomyces sp. NBC_00582]WUB68617.1 pilus assembly protein [Streptomyces sp. NBC_00582]
MRCPAWARRLGRRLREDDGDASLEMLMCFPAALLLVFLVVDACNIYFAKTAATTAAREAIAGARGYGSTPGEGVRRADAVFDRVGDSLLAPRVSASSSAERIEFTVTGKAQSVLGLNITVTEHASGPVERWSNP